MYSYLRVFVHEPYTFSLTSLQSIDAFLNALQACIAIRSNIRQIRCDRGTIFVGAQKELPNLLKNKDQEKVKVLGFLMNPTSANPRGGVWENKDHP